MVAAYTTRIRLTKQGEGDNDSTWGTVLNDEVIDLTDFAIAGYTTISLASGNVTLTSNDGAPDQSRSAMLELTGTLTGNRDVYIPGVSKSYVVRNNTSGAYSATVKVTGGTGHAIQQGESNLIYCDAVSVREVSSPLVTQFTSISTDVLTATSTTGTNAAYTGFVSATNITGASVSATNITGVNVSVTGTIKAASVSTSGNIHAAGEIASQSDERLKSNIKIISGAIDKVKNLKGVTFTFKADDRPSTGLLAQDVQSVMPEVITQNGDYLYVSYGNLLGLIVEAVKELDQKITSKNCKCGK
tara:strand:+ start:53 stop:955 length:903 start_codon:yes stop_codon:yes gene_type:complete